MTKKITPFKLSGMYSVVESNETETHTEEILRTYDGATLICRLPRCTTKEQTTKDRNAVKAIAEFANSEKESLSIWYAELIL